MTARMKKKSGRGCFGAPLADLPREDSGVPMPVAFLFRHVLSDGVVTYNGYAPPFVRLPMSMEPPVPSLFDTC